MSITPLFTIQARHSSEQEIRKSRFLAVAEPVSNVDTALAFIRHASEPKATHNCWAWRLGQEYRFNDDGEPAGSAGRPILAAIDGQNMDGVAVLVTRWFGGIKLGVGGLIRAYGGVAVECLRTAQQLPIVDAVDLVIECGYAEFDVIRHRLAELDARISREDFGAETVRIGFALARLYWPELQPFVRDVTRGQGLLQEAP